MRLFVSSIALAASVLASSSFAATVVGVQALPGGPAKVAGTLIAKAKPAGEALDFVFTRPGESKPITRYDVELTKQLHVIAVGDDLRSFVHQHVEHAAKDGHFRLTMRFPRPGLYHVYADGSPSGIGQQVLRFDVAVGSAAPRVPSLTPGGLVGTDGPYAVRFDSLDLAAGQETMLTMHVEKNGKPAPDLHPFLGVAAHAVLIRRDDLVYVHVHAMAGDMDGMGQTSMPGMTMPAIRDPSTLMLHVAPPEPGVYALWIQFVGGTKLRTVPFVLSVNE